MCGVVCVCVCLSVCLSLSAYVCVDAVSPIAWTRVHCRYCFDGSVAPLATAIVLFKLTVTETVKASASD